MPMTQDDNPENSPRGYHDIGGDEAGQIPKTELPWMHWEKQTEAVRNLLGDGTRRIISLDEMRRGFESFGADKYKAFSFYRRRLEAMIDVLIEKQVITREELDAAIIKKRQIWQRDPDGTDAP
ncbi:MAG: nitrile hydratase subunit beta [Gammaproteobacteria bacterium]